MQGEIHVGDIGLALQYTVYDQNGAVYNISGCQITIKYTPPHNSSPVFTKSGTLVTNGTDGLVQYVTQSGDLSVPGWWLSQGTVNTPGGAVFHSDTQRFRVFGNT